MRFVKSGLIALSFISIFVTEIVPVKVSASTVRSKILEQKFSSFEISPAQAKVGQPFRGFLRLQTGWQSSDEVRAIVTTYIDGQEVSFLRPSMNDDLWIYSRDAFTEEGVHTLSVNVFLEDKSEADALRAQITTLEQEISILEAQIAIEEDPAQKLILQAQVQQKQGLKSNAQSELYNVRTHLGTDNFNFTVIL